MDYFKVEGPTQLSGTFVPKGNKNAALPIIAACLLSKQKIILQNLPEIEDVKIMLQIAQKFGAQVNKLAPNEYSIEAKQLTSTQVDPALGRMVRTSILFAGPLLARKGQITLSQPGGDVIGRRRLDTHFFVFSQLGASYKFGEITQLETTGLIGKFLFLDEASVTGTENAIMTAVLARGDTIIYNAACEPHVQDLCSFLNSLGAQISGIGTNRIKIKGVTALAGGTWRVISDHIEVGSIIGLAAISNSKIRITDIIPEHYINIKKHFNKLGVDFIINEDSIDVPPGQKLVAQSDMDGSIATLADSIWPGFPSDLTSIAVVVATQVQGTSLIFEKMFESRLFFVDKLVSMGAKIILCDPHRAVISGPNRLFPKHISSPDIRAGMAVLIAAMLAEGESKILNIRQIDRGYERIDERLNALGARITRVRD